MLSTIFCAVPAFSRVDPPAISGPTTSSIATSSARESAAPALQLMPTVAAPTRRASETAATTYGVRPDAEMPTTQSCSSTAVVLVGDGARLVVLGALDRGRERVRPARDESPHERRALAEGRGE